MEYNLSILFWLYKSKKNKKGLSPIFMRITLNGEKTEISTGLYISISSWNVEKGIIKGSSIETREMNKNLDLLRGKVIKTYNSLIELDMPISPELIKKKFNNEDSNAKTLLGAIEYHNALTKKKIGAGTTLATYRKYESLRKKITMFLHNDLKRSDIFLKELNHEFIIEFDAFLKIVCSMGHNSAIKDIQFLKKIIHLSVANGWLLASPFQAFKCTLVLTERGYLSMDELRRIEMKEMPIDRLAVVRNMFVLSCYTGLAYADVIRLSPEHLEKKEDGSVWVIMHRTKTKIRSPIPLLPVAIEILDWFVKRKRSDQNTIASISNQKVNAYLKEIATICGITKHLTYHLARHTFATTITLSNGVPIETVSKMLGHKNLKTTQIYAKVVDTKIAYDMKQLKNREKAGDN